MNTRKLTTIAIMSALATILAVTIHFPIIPLVSFLEFEPKGVILAILGFVYGPLSVLAASCVCAVLEVLFLGGTILDMLMNVIANCSFALVAALVYKKLHTQKGAYISLAIGVVTVVITMSIWNYIITPIYYGMPRSAVAELLIPGIMPFNLIKYGVDALFVVYLYKPVVSFLRKNHMADASSHADASNKPWIGIALFVIASAIAIFLAYNSII